MKWKAVNNPEYIPGKSNPLEVDILIWQQVDEKSNTDINPNLGISDTKI